ncbi:hypothetical protein BDQ17DRAFT_1378933 [Cyathus striatus]|nr:hypothetical protein BDQ17DRAFT_1378933 [Cyathus striatus]
MQKRYKAFLANGNPNAAVSDNVHPIILGGSGRLLLVHVRLVLGDKVQYDYQFFSSY